MKNSIILILILINFLKVNSYSLKKCKYDAYESENENDNEFKCYNGGICFKIEHNSTSSMLICNCKPGFTGRQCEESTLTPCSPDPCYPNGYCNSDLESTGYFCRCKPGFTGPNCQENINDCLNATCFNGGSCIDGINSYECDCVWPYIGRYCQTKMKCTTDSICKNNGICIEDDLTGPKCICQPGYEGVDCSIKSDKCKLRPCLNDGKCFSALRNNDYRCECKIGYMGKNCQFKDICYHKMPCKNNSTCISVTYGEFDAEIDLNQSHKYYCQCKHGFTGINCDIKLENFQETKTGLLDTIISTTNTITIKTTTTTTTTTTTSSTSIATTISTLISTNTTSSANTSQNYNETKNNGSFVLIVNINPTEFKKRQNEIIGEFEKRFGILMSIKKEASTQLEMIYSYSPPNLPNVEWTKVYFVFISACIQNDFNILNNDSKTLCLQNNVNNINDVFEVLNELKKSSNLFPKYVSNISYEAYTDNKNRIDLDENPKRNGSRNDTTLTTTLCILSIALLVGISLALTVIIRQQKRVKAPVWFPPLNEMPISNEKSNFDGITTNSIFEMQSSKKLKSLEAAYGSAPTQSNWSISKKIEDFSQLFHKKSKQTDIPPSPENDYGEIDLSKPNKIRKIDTQIYSNINHNNSSASSASTTSTLLIHPPIPQVNQPSSPEFYPSPPESIPDASYHPNILHPVNYKGGSYGLTPLMLFVLGRSKFKYQKYDQSVLDIIDSFVLNGADLNSQNNDGETALHLAARCGLYDICERLIKLNAEFNVFDNYGRNVLHTAVGSNEYNIVKLILDHCASILCSSSSGLINNNQNNLALDEKYDLIDSKTNDELGDTPLIIASRLNLNNIIQLLIEFNATVNATDNEGRSALHWCAKVNNANGALILLKSGANVNMQDNDERTPLSSALNELCTLEMADLLIKFDAFVSVDDEAKYNKMKSIMQTLNGGVSNTEIIVGNNLKETSNSNQFTQNTLKYSKSTVPTSTAGTKRKLSDTLSSTNSSSLNDKNMKSKKANKNQSEFNKTKSKTVFNTPTPSPPPQQGQQVYSIQNNNQYQSYNYYYESTNQNSYEFTYPQSQQHQQQYNQVYLNTLSNPGFTFNNESNKTDNVQIKSSNNGNVNMGYLNDNNYFQNYTNQYQQPNNNTQIYSTHSYTAYF